MLCNVELSRTENLGLAIVSKCHYPSHSHSIFWYLAENKNLHL